MARPSDPLAEMLTYDFPLRPDLFIRLTLPINLTPGEAARFNRFVKALVMDDYYIDLIDAVVHDSACESGICNGECNGPVPGG